MKTELGILKPRHKRAGIWNILLILAFVLATPAAAFAQDPSTHFTATPLTAGTTVSMVKPEILPQSLTQQTGPVSVIVKLKGESLATYSGGIPGLSSTSPAKTGEKRLNVKSGASLAYLSHLSTQHSQFKAAAEGAISGAKVTRDFTLVLNAVSMILPAEQITALAKLPNVAAIYQDTLQHPDTDNSPQFIGAPTVWRQLGGQESSGEGVIVGVLDTGVWPEHPSFSDPDPSGKPYAPPPPASGGPRACDFNTGKNPGPAFTCNNKLIGAHYMLQTYDALNTLLPDEYTSARDDEGHGTHTSSTAAGNAGVQASIFGIARGTVSGIAPRAYVIMYKVCGVNGCYDSDSVAAVQQAILDGVDVINFSISGGASPYSDAVEQAFLSAYDAGVFVAASAGNSGPTPETTDHRGPWVTTVAASTQNRAFANTAAITGDGGASMSLSGASLTKGVGPAPVFVSSTDPQCNKPYAAGSVTGLIVVCERGVTGRAEKGFNVLQGGAAGMILYNQAPSVTDLETDNHFLPAIHVQYADGQALLAFIAAHTNIQATITQGVKVPAQGDVMASFSSRGGPGQTLGVSKPDITAPGVQILAGASPQHLPPPDGVADGPEGELFQAIAGTSMSSPHIAGSGALIKALHPNWTPGQIKSALMTTAWTKVVKEDGVTPATVFDDGSGRVDLSKAGNPGLTFDVTAADYVAHASDLWNVNYPSVYVPVMPGNIVVSRTAHNTLPFGTFWRLDVQGETDFRVDVPPFLFVRPNGDASFKINIDARNVPLGEVRSATLVLKEWSFWSRRTLHIPVTFVRNQPAVTLSKTCDVATLKVGDTSNCTISVQNTSFTDANVKVSDFLPDELRLVPGSVVGATVDHDKRVLSFKGKLAGAQPPDITIAAGVTPGGGYLPLSTLGIAPIAGVGDDTVTNFGVPDFVYAGETYSSLGVGSNGTLIVGGSTGATDATPANQNFPDPTLPNNVIAPFWSDLNPSAPSGGTVSIGVLTDGTNRWIVVDWNAVKEFSTAATDTFEVWIGINGTQDVSFGYGPVGGNGDKGLLTVGAENKFGNRGATYYYNGTGTLPTAATQLVVGGVPGAAGGSQTITFTVKGQHPGAWVNYAQMTSDLFQGTSFARFAGKVTGKDNRK